MAGGTLIAAPWGNPYQWREAQYDTSYLDCRGGSNHGGVFRSTTVLDALIACYKPEKILVVLADTVSQARKRNAKTPIINIDEVDGYIGLISSIRDRIVEWIRRESKSAQLDRYVSSDRLDIEIVPGIGVFNGWRFGVVKQVRRQFNPMESYIAEVAILILSKLLEVKPDRVIIDLSHGINYMPASFYQAAKIATQAYIVAEPERKQIELTYINSEPVTPGESGREVHRIYIVEKAGVDVDSAIEQMSLWINTYVKKQAKGNYRQANISPDRKELKDANIETGKIHDAINKQIEYGIAASRAIVYAMPLALLTLAGEIEEKNLEMRTAIANLMKLLELRNRHTEIDRQGKQIKPYLFLNIENTILAIYTAGLIEYARKIKRTLIPDRSDIKDQGIEITILEKAVDSLGIIYREIGLNEINNIKKRCLNPKNIENCIFPIYIGIWPEEKCNIGSLDIRNLKAHAGLEKNIVEASIRRDSIYLRYRKDCWEELLKKLQENTF